MVTDRYSGAECATHQQFVLTGGKQLCFWRVVQRTVLIALPALLNGSPGVEQTKSVTKCHFPQYPEAKFGEKQQKHPLHYEETCVHLDNWMIDEVAKKISAAECSCSWLV